jgi:phosphoglycerate dehydrogenase-like enzyme
LRWFQSYTAGLEALRQVAGELPDDLRVTSMRGVAAPAIAEHALGLLLSLTRRLDLADRPHTRWRRRRAIEAGGTRPMTLAGSRALVVGLGSVGRHIASLTTALGMETWGMRSRVVPGEPGVRGTFSLDELADRIHGFSVVFNALPLTPRTTGIFDRALFERMSSGSFFINVGRGATVKTADLVAVLARGPLAGAGLDVTDPEPLPVWHPLLRAPNAIITQHRAGVSAYTRRRELLLLRENLRRFQAGEPLLCQADPRLGY